MIGHRMYCDNVDLSPLLSAIELRDGSQVRAWCDAGFRITWHDYKTNLTLCETLGMQGRKSDFVWLQNYFTSNDDRRIEFFSGAARAQSLEFFFN